MLELNNVAKRYGALTVIDDLSLSVPKGRALGIIGPNGAGKTTLFNLIAGTADATRGRIVFEGRDITGVPARQRCRAGIARSFQVPHPFEGMTTFENVLVGATFGCGKGDANADDLAMEALVTTGLVAKANMLTSQLTLLERKRLELARALATGPRLLLLDEIAGGLTEGEVHELVAMIQEIKAQGVTLIWIEHVVHALMAVVDDLAVINFGALIGKGAPQEVINSPEVRSVYLGIDTEAHHA